MNRSFGWKRRLVFLFCLSVHAFANGSQADSEGRIERGALLLGFEEGTGRWNELRVGGDGINLLGGEGLAEVVLEGEDLDWPEDWKTSGPAIRAGERDTLITVTERAEDWSVVREYRLFPDEPMLSHRVRCTWLGKDPLTVWGCRLRVPGVTLGSAGDAVWCFPGNYPVSKYPLREAEQGQSWRERGWTWSDTGVCFAESEEAGRAVLVSFALEEDHATAWVEGEKRGVSLGHRFNTLARVEPGQTLSFGTQWIRIADLEKRSLLQEARKLAETAHPGPPQDRPEWLNGTVLAELHPWGRLESWWTGDKGKRMADLALSLPYLKGLGVRSVWILPVSNKPPWVYFLPAFKRIDPQVATPEGLKGFVDVCHELDMRLLMDLVTYGVSPDSPDVSSLPDAVWCRDKDGKKDKAWGGTVLPADLSAESWQEHSVSLCSYWVKEFGCDGFRLDCGGQGQKPNWAAKPGPKLNLGMLAGGVRQNQRIREAIRRINPSAVLLPEAGNPVHFRSGDLLFDYPFYMVCRELPKTSDTGRWVQNTEAWLDSQKLTHTHRQLLSLVRFLENHDTVAAQEYFGLGPAQALTSLCVFLPGVYLLHQQEEVGMGPLLSSWTHLRHQLPELSTGELDLEGAWAEDPAILSFLRVGEEGATLVSVHFRPCPTTSRIEWRQSYIERFPCAVDVHSGNLVRSGDPVDFPAFGTRVFVLRREARWTSPHREAQRTTRQRERLMRGWVGHGISDRTTRHRIRVGPVQEWYLRTGEGFLWDRFEGYLAEDAPPLDRAWHPWREGFADAAAEVAMGVVSGDGRAVEVYASQPEKLLDLWLEDSSGLGRQVELVVEARPGSIPFEVRELDQAWTHCEEMRGEACYKDETGFVEVDPHWVKVSHPNYTACFSRRRGGVLAELRTPGSTENLLAGCGEIYTDYGLFGEGQHVASEWETNPRLDVAREGDKTRIVFQGRLRRPSWNGVQVGKPATPETRYTLKYTVQESPCIEIDLRVSSEKKREDVKGFLAYRIPFRRVERWEADGDLQGESPANGKRVCEAKGMDFDRVSYRLFGQDGVLLKLEEFSGDPIPPQNPFLLREAEDRMQFFFAVLDGEEATWEENKDYSYSFTLRVE